jgi:ribosomal protein S5
VIAGRAFTIRRVLTDAGASDITTERVLGTALTEYRLVCATFPATA